MSTEKYANAFGTVLASPMLIDDLTATVVSAAPAALQGGQFRVVCGAEIMLVTAGAATTTWTVTRGIEGTTPTAHAGGASIAHGLTAGGLAMAASNAAGTLLAYDEFDRYANGPLGGKVPLVGPAWGTTGTDPTTIVSGRATSVTSGYASMTFAEAPSYLECTMVFTGPEENAMTNAMVWGSVADLDNMLHPIFGTRGFAITLQNDAGGFLPFMEGVWDVACLSDGATPYRFGILVFGETVMVIGPNGELYSGSDARVPGLAASTSVFWEPSDQGTSQGFMESIRAIRYEQTKQTAALNLSAMARIASIRTPAGVIVSRPMTHWETSLIGSGSMPGITFGPTVMKTHLVTAAGIGGVTLVTHDPLMPGSVTIGIGNNAEVVTLSGAPTPYPGVGYPYSHTVTAFTKTHPVGDLVMLTWAGPRPTISYNPWSTFTYFDCLASFTGSIYMPSGALFGPGYLQVVGGRVTGWAAATGDALRTAFATSTVTTEELAKRVKALIDDLTTHGLIGPTP